MVEMEDHTPAPWEADDKQRDVYAFLADGYDPEEEFEGVSIFDAHGNQIAIVPVDMLLGTGWESNLKLMVRAPRLWEALQYGAGAMNGPRFLDFVAWQLEERGILDETVRALKLKAKRERAALAEGPIRVWLKAQRSKYQHLYRDGQALCGSRAKPCPLEDQPDLFEGEKCPHCVAIEGRMNHVDN
jgi:hypothetical protein